MARVLGFLIRYFSNYYTLHRSDLAARAAPLDPRLIKVMKVETTNLISLPLCLAVSGFEHGRLRCKSMIETFTLPIGRMIVKLGGSLMMIGVLVDVK